MSNAAQHTPTPWRDKRNNSAILGADGKTVARYDRVIMSQPELEANAAFIVRAVNSHDALVAALQAYQAAHAMPTRGDASDFVWPEQSMRKPGDHAYGYICAKHGLGYQNGCLCCRDEFDRYKDEKDLQARRDRDDALSAADFMARSALAAVES